MVGLFVSLLSRPGRVSSDLPPICYLSSIIGGHRNTATLSPLRRLRDRRSHFRKRDAITKICIEALPKSREFGFATDKKDWGKTMNEVRNRNKVSNKKITWSVLLGLALATAFLPARLAAQDDQQDDPPTRVARLGYMEGSVSFQPAGETDWVGAVPNRPMTTGDQLWADQNSRAELQLGSAVIRLSANTGVSFLNLDDHTVQLQLSSGTVNVRVRRLRPDDDFEIDTPNLAFTVNQPGSYRVDASEDGTYTVVSVRTGDGDATGNGQTYTVHAGQRVTFSGTDSLNADMEDIGSPDTFDTWADSRDYRHDHSRSVEYLSPDVVGYDDLDDNGDWRDDPNYGHVWFPNHVDYGWAPYHTGHWDWIDPWGYTWVDDSSWGYAPFHYGRWVSIGGHWGWIAGPPAVEPVYAPALVVFIGGGPGGWGGNVGWFPLGPREVFVPSYPVSRVYMNQVNVSNTTVNTTVITNVYNTTVINKTTITNVTYVNRGVQGAVTAVPQNAFASAQPVARVAVKVTPQQIAAASVSGRVAVVPTRQAVLGAHAATANHVAAPPVAVMHRAVVAKATPPPPPVPFAKKQQALAAHPGQPVPKRELASLRPANSAAARPMVKVAPPGKPATATMGHPAAQPNRPASPPAGNAHPAPPANRPAPAQPSRPAAPTQPSRAPAPSRPAPAEAAHPQPNRPAQPPARNEHPPATQPSNRPAPAHPAPAARPQTAPAEHPAQHTPPPAAGKPTPNPKPQTPEEKKREKEQKPPGV